MKNLSTISFVVLIGLICLTPPTLSDRCLEYVNLLDGLETRAIDCPRIISSIDKRQTPGTSDNMFVVKFTCAIDDQSLCEKVNNVYNTAGKFITATLNLKAVVNVNAQFADFCKTQGLCSKQETVLGAGKPSRLIPFQDIDGKMRFIPQALFKQLNLPEHPEYGPDDITAIFNSNVNYWFEGDKSLVTNQVDMLYVVVHELIHGLGFIPGWNDHLGVEALTPGLGISQSSGKFLEVIFDKHLVLYPSGQPFTAITEQLNQFQFNPDSSDEEIAQSFKASPQYAIANDLYQKAMTQGTMAFLTTPNLPPNTELTPDDVVILETSLKPFQPGSSIGHVDLKTYLDSGDFLMMYTYPHATLGQMMVRAGSTNTTGPIGTKLRTVLSILGYDIKPDYVPPVQLTALGDPTDINNVPASNPFNPFSSNSGSSFISFNLVLSLICILLTFIIEY